MNKPDTQNPSSDISKSLVDDASGLQTLYPSAKTETQRHQDNIDRRQRQKDRLPKLFRVKISISTSLTFAFLLLFSAGLGDMWDISDGGEAGSVFQSFGLGLLLAALGALCVKYIMQTFYTFGRSPKVFSFIYGLALLGLYAGALYGMFGSLANINAVLLASAAHAVMVYVLLLALFRVR